MEIFDNRTYLNRIITFDEPKVKKYLQNKSVKQFDSVCTEGLKVEIYQKSELTLTLKVKRGVIEENFGDLIEEIFSDGLD